MLPFADICVDLQFMIKQFLQSLGDAKNKARKYRYRCLCPDCQNKSINSHLVQQHPYLESIAEDGLLYQIIDNDIHPLAGDFNDYKEEVRSISKTLSMPLFCAHHDNDLFKSIESGSVDLKSVKTFLLFSFRALASQRYLEERRNVQYKNNGLEAELFFTQRDYSSHAIARFDSTLKLLHDDIVGSRFDDYVFTLVDLPYMPVCGSDVAVDDDEMGNSYCNGDRTIRPIDGLYITLLPSINKDCLYALVGYHSKHVSARQREFFNSLFNDTKDATILELIYLMKNWCASPSLFAETDFAEHYYCRRVELVFQYGGC